MDIHIDEKNIVRAGSVPVGYILELDIDQALLGYLNAVSNLGLFGESAAESAIYLIRTGLERLVTEKLIKVRRWDD